MAVFQIVKNILKIIKKIFGGTKKLHYCCVTKAKNMTTLELLKAVSAKANETKKELTKSFFSGDKSYFNTMLAAFPKADVNGNVYETINNIASMYARGLEY